MASLSLFTVNPNDRPSSPALLPQGEKGADHGAPHRHPTVGCNKRSAVHHEHILIAVQFTSFFAPYSRHAADMFPFSCVRLRFANRTYGFKTDALYPNRLAAVGCNKRSAVHRDHMADFPSSPALLVQTMAS